MLMVKAIQSFMPSIRLPAHSFKTVVSILYALFSLAGEHTFAQNLIRLKLCSQSLFLKSMNNTYVRGRHAKFWSLRCDTLILPDSYNRASAQTHTG
jgi:hypothetical protein